MSADNKTTNKFTSASSFASSSGAALPTQDTHLPTCYHVAVLPTQDTHLPTCYHVAALPTQDTHLPTCYPVAALPTQDTHLPTCYPVALLPTQDTHLPTCYPVAVLPMQVTHLPSCYPPSTPTQRYSSPALTKRTEFHSEYVWFKPRLNHLPCWLKFLVVFHSTVVCCRKKLPLPSQCTNNPTIQPDVTPTCP